MIQKQKESFLKKEHIIKRVDFLKRHPEDRVIHARGYRFIFKLSNLPYCRLGIVVTRKDGDAVYRNRVKRVLREVFRKNKNRIEPPMDLIVIRRRPAVFPTYEDALKQFNVALEKIAGISSRKKQSLNT
jgi:ribonuclease P protein component